MAGRLLCLAAFLALTAVLLPSPASAAEVDCTKATNPAQHTICTNPALTKLDKEAETELKRNVTIFSDGSAKGGPVLADLNDALKPWLQRRDACGDKVDCLNRAYADLLATLEFHGRPGKDAWADKTAGVFTYQGYANLWIQVRDDDSVRVSLTEVAPGGNSGSCDYVAIGHQDGKFLRAGTLELDVQKGSVNIPPIETNLRTNGQSCRGSGSMIWRYGARR